MRIHLQFLVAVVFTSFGLSWNVASAVLIADYSFNQGTAQDDSGNGNHAVVQGPSPTADRFGNLNSAYSFDGTGFIQTPLGSNFKPQAFSAWFRALTLGGAQSIVDSDRHSQYGHSLILDYDDGTDGDLFVEFHNGSGSPGVNGRVELGTWHHAVVNFGANVELYLDGTLVFDQAYDATVFDGESYRIGRHNSIDPQWFHGDIDDVKFFDGVLSESEVVSLYNAPNPIGFGQSAEVRVSPRSTFLQPVDPREDLELVENAKVVDLATELPFVVSAGDYLRLQAVGDFDFATGDDNLGGPFGDGTLRDLTGVFSSSPEPQPTDLSTSPLPSRVPNSEPVLEGTAPSVGGIGGFPETDILNDFLIPSETGTEPNGVVVRVPEGATHLFLGAFDGVWGDNNDPNGEESDPDFGVRIIRIYEGRLVGDYNFDGVVDASDYTVWRDSLGETGIDPAADGNLNGTVDAADYEIWRQGYGTVIGSEEAAGTLTIPEPASSVLGFCYWGVLIASMRRIRRPRHVVTLQALSCPALPCMHRRPQ